MTNEPLRSAGARGWGSVDDITNGEWLMRRCPGRNGPSDIDNEPWRYALHNAGVRPHREACIEFKPALTGNLRTDLKDGQRLLLEDRGGVFWRTDGLMLERRVFLVGIHDGSAFELVMQRGLSLYQRVPVDTLDELALLICGWLWPDRNGRVDGSP